MISSRFYEVNIASGAHIMVMMSQFPQHTSTTEYYKLGDYKLGEDTGLKIQEFYFFVLHTSIYSNSKHCASIPYTLLKKNSKVHVFNNTLHSKKDDLFKKLCSFKDLP